MNRTGGVWEHLEPTLFFVSAWTAEPPKVIDRWVDEQGLDPDETTVCALISPLFFQKRSSVLARSVDRVLDFGWPVMFDSGVFSLAKEAGVMLGWEPMDDPGWRDLQTMLDRVLRWWGDRIWGLVEVDGGNWQSKTKRREILEDRWGFGLMPVYHFGQDPWEYFDLLVTSYDRICVSWPPTAGREESSVRNKLFYEVEARLVEAQSECWIHDLGASPILPHMRTWQPHSYDGTRWLQFVRGYTTASLDSALMTRRVMGVPSQGMTPETEPDRCALSAHAIANQWALQESLNHLHETKRALLR